MKKIRGNDLLESGIKPVPNPSGHYVEVYGFVDSLDAKLSVANEQVESLKQFGELVYVVGRLQLMFGCRISEILNIKQNDIDRLGRIMVQGMKGSQTRMVVDSEMKHFWLKKRSARSQQVFEFNRQFIDRCYRKVGLRHEVEGAKKGVCSHYLRHMFAKSIQSKTQDVSETQAIIGHKSGLSTHQYLKSKIK